MVKLGPVVATAAGMMLLGLAPSLGANAKPLTLEQYQRPKTAKDLKFNKDYLIGAKDALIAYNMTTQHKLFCMPGVIPSMSFDRANNIVMRWAHKSGAAPDLPVARALLFGMIEAYRCH